MSRFETTSDVKRMLHDLASTLSIISVTMENMRDIWPTLTEAYKVAVHYQPQTFSSLCEEDLMLMEQTLTGMMPRIDQLHHTFNQLRETLKTR